ncbi:pleckstrin homology domain-containing family A member 8-like isoform X2 [Clavelina lepadiformis]|uniref:Pleckstrin homology domain-containing family A member 8 n=1 Tax=Clavelina lepadiformis TaxID=159417 RepID=A0ABP0F469_CLALP
MSLNSDIEGTLFKWTNYWGGWQARWVVLHGGVLSYYNSVDEVGKGCRASINLTASDIIAYPNDNTRFDVVVANEQRWYLKAANPGERQAWLISLGTSKANQAEKEVTPDRIASGSHDKLRQSMGEVRLFCDLLVRQAVNVKVEAQKDQPDIQKISDSSTLLSTTCDTFLATLGRCMDLSESVLAPPTTTTRLLRSQSSDGQHALPKLRIQRSKQKKHTTKSIGQSPSWSPSSLASNKAAETDPPLQTSSNEVTSPSTNLNSETSSLSSLTTSDSASSKTSESNKTRSNSPLKQNTINEKLNSSEANSNQVCEALHEYRGSPVEEETMLTFFSAMLHSFSDIVLEEDGGISTISFLSACEGIIPFLDTIGSTAFAPVKMDFMGNISKLRTKHSSEPSRFATLQGILHQEIATSTTKVRNSATDALMWLKRGLRFMQKFLLIFMNGERNLTFALNQAYSVTLKPYHGWVVKGIFALAVKAAPYPNNFIKALATNPDHAQDKRFLGILMEDVDQYTTAMDVVLNIVDNFYDQFKLESTAVV